MYHRVDKHSTLSQAISERFDRVSSSECKVVIGKRYAGDSAAAQKRQQLCNIQPRADIEVRFVEVTEKLKHAAAGPPCQINIAVPGYFEILCHAFILPESRASVTV